jgi:hypothetical protein
MRLTWWRNLMMTKRRTSKDLIMRSNGENKTVLSWNKRSLILLELRDRRRGLGLSKKMVLMVVVMGGTVPPLYTLSGILYSLLDQIHLPAHKDTLQLYANVEHFLL